MAGISVPEDVSSGRLLDDAERMVATNVLGPLRLVVELVPPGVRTELMSGQSEIEQFLPVDNFADQVLALIEWEPEATETLANPDIVIAIAGVELIKTPLATATDEQFERVTGRAAALG